LSQNLRYSIAFACLGALTYLPFLGGVHLFDWDEINFAEAAREMLVNNDYLRVFINFQPFWQKPPFFFWLQAASMHFLGVGEYAARLPNAICGILTLVILFRIGIKLHSVRFGLLWAGAYYGSTLPLLYFKSGIIDPWFNLFILLGLYYFILFYWRKEHFSGLSLSWSPWAYLLAGGFFIGLGMLTKGPVALLLAGLTMGVYWVYKRFRLFVSIPQIIFFLIASGIVGAAWLGLETLKNGDAFVREFFTYQYRLFSTPDAGHKGFPGYHVVVLLFGCFPASIFAIRALGSTIESEHNHFQDFQRWMRYLFWVVLVLFSVVQSKIVHYSSMAYFPLTFLAAVVMLRMMEGKIPMSRWMRFGLASIAGIIAVICIAVPILGKNPAWLKTMLSDPFAAANLEAKVEWTGWEVLPGFFLLWVVILFFRLYKLDSKARGFAILFAGNAIFVMLALIFFVRRVEGYSQNAAIEFFKSKATEDCYIITYGYKSYAHLFYAAKRPENHPLSHDQDWLLNSPDVDKPVYIAAKIHRAEPLRSNPQLIETGALNGFVFFKRNKPQNE
jgi:4-amino-4-deoxy-L-arabinose transferase-like glycosyltransferase